MALHAVSLALFFLSFACFWCSCKHCTHSHNQLVQSPITGLSCLSCPAQFTSAKLSVFNNQWSAVHDFTKDLEDGNWSVVLDDAPDIEVTGEEFGEVGLSFSREQSVVPHTTGLGQKASGSGEVSYTGQTGSCYSHHLPHTCCITMLIPLSLSVIHKCHHVQRNSVYTSSCATQ